MDLAAGLLTDSSSGLVRKSDGTVSESEGTAYWTRNHKGEFGVSMRIR
jgi:hypothetical protein